jgi:[acyl-carrier-protein] S-malonyltransferase
LSFEDGLALVFQRALAMQEACEINPSSMAAILGLEDQIVEQICAGITEEIVVAANYNCPGQLVISGSTKGIEIACELLKAAGAKRALPLPVGGAFHSPLMEPAREKLQKAIEGTQFNTPICPIYQNVSTTAVSDVTEIKANLIAQLTAPVKWTQSVQQMVADGATEFIECGPGKVLQGLVKKIHPEAIVSGL